MGDCKFLDGTCWYSHCLKYLGPSRKKAQALATRREAAGKGTDVDKLLERMKAVKQSGDYEPDTQGYKVRVRQSDGSVAFEWSSDDDESVESIVGPYGYAQDNVDLLMEQGIKPWDDEADVGVLRLLRNDPRVDPPSAGCAERSFLLLNLCESGYDARPMMLTGRFLLSDSA